MSDAKESESRTTSGTPLEIEIDVHDESKAGKEKRAAEARAAEEAARKEADK